MPTIRTVRSPLNLSNLMARFDNEIKCREFLESLRWPNGAKCPKCGEKEIARVQGREAVLRCVKCQQQFSVTAGTVFNDSHLPLAKWFIATFILTQSKKGVSACQIQRMLGIGSYKTAWYLCHRIRNRRKSETLFQDTLRYMVNAPVLTFDTLTGKEEAA